ncbi:MAG: epoxide hydrolase family protein [Acidobacteriota bacterium]|jgi:pimeloyl-ACP methyl ester carboxylesterase|nr:epoxide hydrolase [Acidobacteriaceae bacterium]
MMLTRRSFFQSSAATCLAAGRAAGAPGMQPYRIRFSSNQIRELRRRLAGTRWPEMPFETGWAAGISDSFLRELFEYWRGRFDWLAAERRLNQLTHVRGLIGGEQMHAVVMRADPARRAPFPVVFLHGWPSSFLEFTAAGELIRRGRPGGPGFDVVIPSLPGFVFSESPRQPGMNMAAVADRIHQLMAALGYERFAVHGTDFGILAALALCRRHAGSITALQLQDAPQVDPLPEGPRSPLEAEFFARRQRLRETASAYRQIQTARPQTLGYALHDSPLGLLAWLTEKFWEWGGHGDDFWGTFERDSLLTNVTLYWLTGCILPSMRYYWENRPLRIDVTGEPLRMPTGILLPLRDPWSKPRSLADLRLFGNLKQVEESPTGGHFFAWEQPQAFAAEVIRFLEKL